MRQVRRHAPAKSMPGIPPADSMPEVLQTGTQGKPLPWNTIGRLNGVQVLRRNSPLQKRVSKEHRPMRAVQSPGTHGQCVSTKVAAASRDSKSKTATSGGWCAPMRTLWTGQHPRIQMDLRRVRRTRDRRWRLSHKMPRMLNSKGEKRDPTQQQQGASCQT